MDLLFRIEPVQSDDTSGAEASVKNALAQTKSLDSSSQTKHFDSSSIDSHHTNRHLKNNAFTFSPLGGLIGRSVECDWVLDDPELRLSGKHAAISFEDSQYFITDISTNGLFVNDSPKPLGKANTHPIASGDRFSMGPYTAIAFVKNELIKNELTKNVLVKDELTNKNATSFDIDECIGDDETIGYKTKDEISFVEHEHLLSADSSGLDDVLELPKPIDTVTEYKNSSTTSDAKPNDIVRADTALNSSNDVISPREHYSPKPAYIQPTSVSQPLSSTESTSPTNPSSTGSVNPVVLEGVMLQFLRGAGLSEDLMSHPSIDEIMFGFGSLLKCYTGETMKLMGERSSYKNRSRLDMTLVAPDHNNPLKYCVNESQALREIVISPQPENLSGAAAVESAIEDIRNHYWRVEKGYQGTLSALIDYLGTESGRSVKKKPDNDSRYVNDDNKIFNKYDSSDDSERLSMKPWQYRKQIKHLKRKKQLLNDPQFYDKEFFSPRFSYYYQNPEQVKKEPVETI